MTLSGAIATLRPDVDMLAVTGTSIVRHDVRAIDKTRRPYRFSTARTADLGEVDRATGTYTATANAMTETQRRTAGLRRNGQPRRRA